jgi:TonB family protein
MIAATPAATPAASASPTATCDRGNLPIAIVSNLPNVTVYPGNVKERRLEVLVRVSVSARGNVIDARVEKSSGYSVVDDAAVAVARKHSYLPKLVDCKELPTTYLIHEDFVPDN